MSNRTTRRPLRGIQSLQSRELMAGDVSVNFASSDARDLEVTGDYKDNSIRIEEIATDTIQIRGLDGTRVNGRTVQTFRITDDLRINMGKGNDRVTIKNLNLNNFSHSDLVIDMQDGADILEVVAADVAAILRARMSAGPDVATIDQSNADRIELDGGLGNDFLRITDSTSQMDLVANGREDNDLVEIIDSFASDDIRVSGEFGDDVLRVIDAEAIDDIVIDGGNGEDGLFLFNSTAGDLARLTGGTNDDAIFVYEVLANRLALDAGTGNDEVLVSFSNFSGLMEIDLGAGNDFLELEQNYASQYITDGGSGNDMCIKREWPFMALRYNLINF